jgi:hypothetical protein
MRGAEPQEYSLYFKVRRHSSRRWIGREVGSKPLGQNTSRWTPLGPCYAAARMNPDVVHPLLCAAVVFAVSACAPEIGDECETALDCSSQGSRLCDRTQPHGYCTLRGCESGTCPEDSVCVKFRPAQERLATTYCMAKCSEDGDCRSDDGYRCTGSHEFGQTDAMEVEILGSSKAQFCSALAIMSLPEAEADPEPEADDDAGGD